jgi:hypothetical protein
VRDGLGSLRLRVEAPVPTRFVTRGVF